MADRHPTEPATPRRLRRARREGDHPISARLVGTFALGAGLLALPLSLNALLSELEQLLRASVLADPRALLMQLPARVLWLCLPVLGASALGALVVGACQTGGIVTLRPLRYDAGRLNPLTAFARGAWLRRAAGVLWSVAVVAILAATARSLLASEGSRLIASMGDVSSAAQLALDWSRHLVAVAVAVSLGGAVAHAVFVRHAWLERLRMTREEVLREQREAEGDPELGRARRRVYQELLRETEADRVAVARLVVGDGSTSCTALAYDPQADAAPRVVAQGLGPRRLVISSLAESAGVPVCVVDPALARQLARLPLDEEIPPTVYAEVADLMGRRLAREPR